MLFIIICILSVIILVDICTVFIGSGVPFFVSLLFRFSVTVSSFIRNWLLRHFITIPTIYHSDEEFYRKIISAAPILTETYVPTLLWGYCGHIQTVLFALIGRFNCPDIQGERITLKLDDGTTLSYDIFHETTAQNEDIMFFVAPGFANNAETDYIRTFTKYATNIGYRCAVLNHIGTLADIPVTTPRIFSFGNTDDLHAALTDCMERFSDLKVILIGYSLGGNLVLKYLGEDRKRSKNVIAGLSICSLLDANRAIDVSNRWRIMRYFYQYFLARTIKKIVKRHEHILLSEDVLTRHGLKVNPIFNAMSLVRFDEVYTRRIHNFASLQDYYQWCSAINYLVGIKVPVIFVNSLDDPLLSEVMQLPIRTFVGRRKKALAIELKYGGHLGFFVNNAVQSDSLSWIEKMLIQVAQGLKETLDDAHSDDEATSSVPNNVHRQ